MFEVLVLVLEDFKASERSLERLKVVLMCAQIIINISDANFQMV